MFMKLRSINYLNIYIDMCYIYNEGENNGMFSNWFSCRWSWRRLRMGRTQTRTFALNN